MAITRANSPLRYPGGKQVLSTVLGHLLKLNGATGGVYVEPYAGGAGAALTLLFDEHVDQIVVNDADPAVYALWHALLNRTDEFVKLLETTPATVEEWRRQRAIYQKPARYSMLSRGFATFFLNRCNRSGIIATGGPIGGLRQEGAWKIDARLNREQLGQRIRKIAMYRDRIQLFNLDAIHLLKTVVEPLSATTKTFVYLDPPYFHKARELYLKYYSPLDHAVLADRMALPCSYLWVMSYDNVPEIRRLYRGFRQVAFDLGYSARDTRTGTELLIANREFIFPRGWRTRIPSDYITCADRTAPLPR